MSHRVSGALLPRPHRSLADRPDLAFRHDVFPGLYCPGLIEAPPPAHPGGGEAGFPGLYCPGLIEASQNADPRDRTSTVSGALLPRPHRSQAKDHHDAHRYFAVVSGALLPRPHRSRARSRCWSAPTTFPGLYCPGLIEAASLRSRAIISSPFPGLYCPGLIEAWDGEAGGTSARMFPGLYCPGLIEARASSTPRRPGSPVSGALLPRPHRSPGARRLRGRRSAFPGLYCPGLIEAYSSPGRQLPVFGWFPGLYCPGLIEARQPATGNRQPCLVSGALLPRPHRSTARAGRPPRVAGPFPGLYCPGLIEAMIGCCCRHRLGQGFRGSIAPASSKPPISARSWTGQTGFRGSIAPASSKPPPRPRPGF